MAESLTGVDALVLGELAITCERLVTALEITHKRVLVKAFGGFRTENVEVFSSSRSHFQKKCLFQII